MPDVVQTDGVLGGEPRLAGHRISVLQVVDLVLDGEHDPAGAADQLDISLAAVHAALAYYYDHPDEMEAVRARHEELEGRLSDRATDPEQVEP